MISVSVKSKGCVSVCGLLFGVAIASVSLFVCRRLSMRINFQSSIAVVIQFNLRLMKLEA